MTRHYQMRRNTPAGADVTIEIVMDGIGTHPIRSFDTAGLAQVAYPALPWRQTSLNESVGGIDYTTLPMPA